MGKLVRNGETEKWGNLLEMGKCVRDEETLRDRETCERWGNL